MKYTKQYTVRWHDTGPDREVVPSRVLELMQETASLQCKASGYDLDVVHERDHRGFILVRLSMEFLEPLYAFDELEVDTWVAPGHGVSFPRYFSVRKGEREAVRAVSTWALVDFTDRSFLKVSEFPREFPVDDPVVLSPSVPLRAHIPASVVLSEVGKRQIAYAELDYNLHMNNTKYPDMLCDFLPERDAKRIRSMAISYLHESRYKDLLTVFRAEESSYTEDLPGGERVYWLRTVLPDGEAGIEARITTEARK